jgi:hypothetical protein
VLAKLELIGRGPDYVFRGASIEVLRTEKMKLTEVLGDLHLSPVAVL